MRLLIQLVREIEHFSGLNQGILKWYFYGNHEKSIFFIDLNMVFHGKIVMFGIHVNWNEPDISTGQGTFKKVEKSNRFLILKVTLIQDNVV